jgi:predicted DNA-binding protein
MTDTRDLRCGLVPQQALLTGDLARRLDAHATRTGLKKSEIIRQALEAFLRPAPKT